MNATATAPPAQPSAVSAGTLEHPDPAADPEDPAPIVEAGDGVTVPGGWLPHETAGQVAAAAALVWLRRRRGYQPGHRKVPQRADPELAPLPATVAAVQVALATDPTHQDAAAERPPTEQAWLAIPASIAALPTTGVTLTGPGAGDAARGVLVTALLAALRDPPDAVRLVITRSALTTLLATPAMTEVCDGIPALRVTETADHAVELIDSHLAPLATQPSAQSVPGADRSIPRLVLISDSPAAAATNRLAAMLSTGKVTAVVLGAWAQGATWSVDQHDRTHDARDPGQAGPRLCSLDPVAAMDLLTVMAHIRLAPVPAPQPATDTQTAALHEQPRQFIVSHVRIPRQAGEDRAAQPTPAAGARPRVELQVLGKPRLLVDGHAVTIRRSAAVQVLVFLAVHRQGATSAQMVQAIWPGLAAHTVTGRLYTTLSELRGAIRAACGLTIIDHTDDRYRLLGEHLDTDLWRLRTAAHHAATALTDPATAWQFVIDAHTGDLAADHTWPWVDPHREATRRLVLDAYAAAASAQPDPHRALELLERGIRVDPYNENLHQRAIEVLTALDDHTGAAGLLDAYQRRLTRAGLHPSDRLHQVLQGSIASTSQ
ncbi:hypothetical protein [Micromonospora sp. RTP1Z1]|uniref:hypothetical protein n=1 Tax=Micromonospora sp. RTP1Z1 TaxID=2994043 RepID=UPI0029C6E3AB|nr:hypothetical protein [Micromonospora sp. RTP1Z1]